MKHFILLYDETIPGHGIFKRGTIVDAFRETSTHVYVQLDDIVWRFSKLHVVETIEREQ